MWNWGFGDCDHSKAMARWKIALRKERTWDSVLAVMVDFAPAELLGIFQIPLSLFPSPVSWSCMFFHCFIFSGHHGIKIPRTVELRFHCFIFRCHVFNRDNAHAHRYWELKCSGPSVWHCFWSFYVVRSALIVVSFFELMQWWKIWLFFLYGTFLSLHEWILMKGGCDGENVFGHQIN